VPEDKYNMPPYLGSPPLSGWTQKVSYWCAESGVDQGRMYTGESVVLNPPPYPQNGLGKAIHLKRLTDNKFRAEAVVWDTCHPETQVRSPVYLFSAGQIEEYLHELKQFADNNSPL
jgi:hypothetical protein